MRILNPEIHSTINYSISNAYSLMSSKQLKIYLFHQFRNGLKFYRLIAIRIQRSRTYTSCPGLAIEL